MGKHLGGMARLAIARTAVLAIVAGVATVGAVGCGSSDTGDKAAGGAPGTSGALKLDVDATLASSYAGEFDEPTTTGPKAVRGKSVWFIGCGVKFEACATSQKYFTGAARELGWAVKAPDTQGNTALASQFIRNAIASKADGIVLMSNDCGPIKSSLERAKAARVPVVSIYGTVCEGASLVVPPRLLGSTDITRWFEKRARSDARFELAAMAKSGIDTPEINLVSFRDQVSWDRYYTAWLDQAKKDCPDCKIVETKFNVAQFPSPAVQIIKTGLVSNPAANGVAISSDFMFSSGLLPAFTGARNLKLMCCGDGQSVSRDLVRSGKMFAASVIPFEMMMWQTANTLNRVLAGEAPDELPNEGGGFVYLNKDTVGAEGTPVKLPTQFKSIYTAMWSGSGAR